mgnify:CR=1 FL=1
MVDNVFIKAAQEAFEQKRAQAEAEHQEKVKHWATFSKDFEANVAVWLGDLVKDETFCPGETWIDVNRDGFATFIYTFGWYGMQGEITSGGWGTDKFIYQAAPILTMKLPSGDQEKGYQLPISRDKKADLPRSDYRNEVAVPVDPAQFGAYLLQQMGYMDGYNAAQERRKIQALIETDFRPELRACKTAEDVDAVVTTWLEKVPEPWHRDIKASGEATKELLKEAAEQQAEAQCVQERTEAYYAAKGRLEKELAAMFVPFTLYKLSYCINAGGALEHCWVTAPKPDANGWWNALEAGGVVVKRKFGFPACLTMWEFSNVDAVYQHPGLPSVLKRVMLTSQIDDDLEVEVSGIVGLVEA